MALLSDNIGLIGVAVVIIFLIIAMVWRETILDLVKANLGLIILLVLFSVMLAVAFHVYHESAANPSAKDFLAWLEQKAGEVLASIMTLIVGVRAANARSSDPGGGKPSPSPAPSSGDHP